MKQTRKMKLPTWVTRGLVEDGETIGIWAACAIGAEPEEALEALKGVLPARGRLEAVQQEPFLVLVDYAHTDDALAKALRTVRGQGYMLV